MEEPENMQTKTSVNVYIFKKLIDTMKTRKSRVKVRRNVN